MVLKIKGIIVMVLVVAPSKNIIKNYGLIILNYIFGDLIFGNLRFGFWQPEIWFWQPIKKGNFKF